MPRLPPVQLIAVLTVIVPAPEMLPAFKLIFLAVRPPFEINEPPAMFSVPLLMVDPLVWVSEPPVMENTSSPRNTNDFGVCAPPKMLMVCVPGRSGICAFSFTPGSCPKLQFVPRPQSPPAAFVQVSKPPLTKLNEVPPYTVFCPLTSLIVLNAPLFAADVKTI